MVRVLMQTSHDLRDRLAVNRVSVGQMIGPAEAPVRDVRVLLSPGSGSVIDIAAIDARLISSHYQRLAKRNALGVARAGGAGEFTSGDVSLFFATGNDRIRTDFNRASGVRPGGSSCRG